MKPSAMPELSLIHSGGISAIIACTAPKAFSL